MENHSEKIQDYIEGLLDGEDLIEFEACLSKDNELRNMVGLQREVHTILNRPLPDRDKPVKKTLAEVNQRYGAKTVSPLSSVIRCGLIIAAVGLLSVGLLYLWRSFS